MSTATLPSRDVIKADFVEAMKGHLDQARIDKAAAALDSMTTSYGGTMSIASLILYAKVQITLSQSGSETFNGKAWGIATPGAGAYKGDLYTDNLGAVYSNTTSFYVFSNAVYSGVYLYDDDGNLLGTFQCGGISTVIGNFGGSGSWS